MAERKAQQERAVATRRSILDAAAVVLAEQGWRAAKVVGVAKQAGVTHGAVQHHFSDREGLFVAATQHLLDTRVQELETAAARIPPGPDQVHDLVRAFIDSHLGIAFSATLQLCVAARSEPAIRPQVLAMELEMGRRAFWGIIEVLGLDRHDRTTRLTVQAFLDSARGLGLAAYLGDDTQRREQLVLWWADALGALKKA